MAMIKSTDELRQILKRIDHKSYGFYKDLAGGYNFGEYQLFIDHVQGDPFATPSRVRFVAVSYTHLDVYKRQASVLRRPDTRGICRD